MQTKHIIILVAFAIFGFSTYMVFTLLHTHNSEIQPDSYFRFQFLFYIQIFLALALLVLARLNEFYQQILCTFFIFLAIFVTIFTSEAILHGRSKPVDFDELVINPKSMTTLQSIYNDVYYLIYMYSIMGITLTGMFIFVSEGMTCWQSAPINRFEGILETIPYNEMLEGEDCAICLMQFREGVKFTCINKCGHIFHQECLKEWIRYNKICPMDRRSIIPL